MRILFDQVLNFNFLLFLVIQTKKKKKKESNTNLSKLRIFIHVNNPIPFFEGLKINQMNTYFTGDQSITKNLLK